MSRWEQIVLGLGLETLIGSKMILCILNRLGYGLSYDEVKALKHNLLFQPKSLTVIHQMELS